MTACLFPAPPERREEFKRRADAARPGSLGNRIIDGLLRDVAKVRWCLGDIRVISCRSKHEVTEPCPYREQSPSKLGRSSGISSGSHFFPIARLQPPTVLPGRF